VVWSEGVVLSHAMWSYPNQCIHAIDKVQATLGLAMVDLVRHTRHPSSVEGPSC